MNPLAVGPSASMPAIQKGDEATITAVRPLGTHCSAQATAAVADAEQQKAEQRSASPRRSIGKALAAQREIPTSSTAPAIVQRMPDISSGGIVSSVTRIAEVRGPPDHADGDPREVGQALFPCGWRHGCWKRSCGSSRRSPRGSDGQARRLLHRFEHDGRPGAACTPGIRPNRCRSSWPMCSASRARTLSR